MQQYYVKEELSLNALVLMDEEQSHHIKKVMRMKEGNKVILADKLGQQFYGNIKYQDNKVYVEVNEQYAYCEDDKVEIILASALIKKDKWDFLLQKCSELGVSEIIPFESLRCVVKMKDEKSDKKLERWRKILSESGEQCKRSKPVSLNEVIDFKQLSDIEADVKLVAYEDCSYPSLTLKEVLNQYSDIKRIVVVVGCEGGFDPSEITYLQENGYTSITLGKRILRAETAAMALVDRISFYYDD